MRELKIGKNDAGQRLDKFITKALDLPTSLLYKSIRLKKIKVNRKRAEISMKLAEGDVVQCFLAEEFFKKSDTPPTLSNIVPHISVVYEDENILLVSKRPGVSVHEDEDGGKNNLITHIQAYLYQKGEYSPESEQSFAPALCNRIDRNTAGIVIAAKNAEALRVMNEKIKLREIDKFYLAAVHGTPKQKEALLTGYLLKDSKTNTVRVYDKNPPRDAKDIRTKYRTLATRNGLTLIEVELLTGRTHQIRAHMAHIGHSLLGDGKYGVNREDRQKGYKYQALCSYKLRFSFDTEREKTVLDYLSGREFTVPKEEIYFLSEFPDAKIK
ncbi:MAG: RluA family pseudouridine synthase [Clostridia bacterium]|nr:RluA family pseudouridine synthase [Clostridia bacterium]